MKKRTNNNITLLVWFLCVCAAPLVALLNFFVYLLATIGLVFVLCTKGIAEENPIKIETRSLKNPGKKIIWACLLVAAVVSFVIATIKSNPQAHSWFFWKAAFLFLIMTTTFGFSVQVKRVFNAISNYFTKHSLRKYK